MKSITIWIYALAMLVSSCELSDNINTKITPRSHVKYIFTNALRDGLAHTNNIDQNVNVSRCYANISIITNVIPAVMNFATGRFRTDNGIQLI